MTTLPPKLAADMASSIYLMRENLSIELIADRFKQVVAINPKSSVAGRSGASMIAKKSCFGLIAYGVNAYENDVFVMLRGTATGYDVLTDLNAGFALSKTGGKVHLGFNTCFNSLLTDLEDFISNHKGKPIRNIHCVGHSLGGALASMAADWLSNKKIASDIKLYTFGSPRVGINSFATTLTHNLGGQNIYRAYHQTDPVSMVPLWPFVHVPEKGPNYKLNSPGRMISPAAHKMANYINSVSKSDWGGLVNPQPSNTDHMIERWLKSDGIVSFTANTVELINTALWYVLKKILHVAGISIQLAFGSSITLLDQLTYVLKKGLDFSKDLSNWVVYLLKKMMQVLGMAVVDLAEMTMQFIRNIFQRMSQAIESTIVKTVSILKSES